MCWRFTLAVPAVFSSRFAACVSPDSASPCSLLSSMMILQLLPELLEAADDLRLAEIVGDDTNLGLFLDRLIEQVEDRLARFEAHPGERLVLLGMRGFERQARPRPLPEAAS